MKYCIDTSSLLEAWTRRYRAAFQALTSDIQAQATEILRKHPRLVDQRPGKGLADPWVIATAVVTGTAVATEEDTGNVAKPKIPYVCQTLQIRSLRIVTLIQEQKWTFA